MDGKDESSGSSSDSGEHRFVLSESSALPFFQKHSNHMPVVLQLAAEVMEGEGKVVVKTQIPGVNREDIEVSATPQSIDISLNKDKQTLKEESDAGGLSALITHSSYALSTQIDPLNLDISFEDGVLTVTALEKKVK